MRHKKKKTIGLLALAAALILPFAAVGCGGQSAASAGDARTTATSAASAGASSTTSGSTATDATGTTDASSASAAALPTEALVASFDDDDEDAVWDSDAATAVTLAGSSISVEGSGATVEGSTLTVNAPGTYVLSGALSDGRVVVDSKDDGLVRLVLAGVDIACSDSAPLYVKNAEKTVITLAEGSTNVLSDSGAYVFPDAETTEPDAALFSADDLTINGSGSLTVNATYADGITSKDELRVTGGTITVTAVGDAITGKDLLGIKGGSFTLQAGSDGLKATNDTDAEKGFIYIEGGTFDITCGTDGLQAETTLGVAGGTFTVSTGGGSANSSNAAGQPGNTWGDWGTDQGPGATAAGSASTGTDSSAASAKALKAAAGVFVSGGEFSIDSSDDAIHSNGNVTVSGGVFAISSGDDGVHADAGLQIDGGELTISQSYEGLEGATVTFNDGTVHVTASDDGINVAGGADSSSTSGRPGQDAFTVNENNQLRLNGGYMVLDAGGDGLDCNGRVFMSGGIVIVNGPTNDGNGALDYLGEFTITGGFLVAAGSTGMAEAPSDTSTQHSLMVNLDTAQQAGTLIHIESEDGAELLTMAPSKQYQSVVVCSPDIAEGVTYTVHLGGTSTGALVDTVYSDGSYSGGDEVASLTVSGMVTVYGTAGRGMGGGPAGATGRTKPQRGTLPGGTAPDETAVPDGAAAPGAAAGAAG